MRHLATVMRGFLMGSADVVPGVSGGTVALVLGIYERLVHNVRLGASALGAMSRGRWADTRSRFAEVEWPFLVPLLIGVTAAIVTVAAVLDNLLEDHPQNMAALFFGLVVGSIVIAWRLVNAWTGRRKGVGAAAAIAAFALLGLRGDEITEPALFMFAWAGAIAVIAMILPGISGSFILLMLGMYVPVIDAVNNRSAAELAVFALAAVLGLAVFSTVLDQVLADHHDTVMAALIGLMAGSLRVLWPWPDGTDTADLARPDDWAVPILLCLLGLAAVFTFAWTAGRSSALRSTT